MSNQLQITGGAKVRNLEGVLTGTSGVVSSLGINVPSGIPQLDGSGKILVSQLPNSVMEYKGTWDASTNTPTLANGTGNQGDVYLCSAAGTVNFGAGPITFAVGDQVIYSGSIWQKASGATGTVTSVSVTESGDALTITGSPITTSGTINIGFAGTGSQYIKGDGTLATFPTTIAQAQKLITEVYNETGSTLYKGTVVYINGGHGNLPTVTPALATSDATSAQTYGVVQSDITNNNNGYVVVIGSLSDLDTSAYANGTQLYLSGTTAGAWTSTKPSAPIHLVYVGVVVRSHPTQGVVEIKIQNGYELEELHDVSITSPSNNQGIFYNSSTSLWENKSIATALGYTPANDSLVVHLAGTETITGAKTFNALTAFTFLNGTRMDYGLYLSKGSVPSAFSGSTVNLYSDSGNNNLVVRDNSNTSLLQFQASSSYTYTFPASTGTIALTSNLSSYVPYTGATTNVDLGSYDLTVYNIKVGRGAGGISTNTLLSYGGLQANTTGYHNVAIGTNALLLNTTGYGNTAIGSVSSQSITTGFTNTAIGYQTLGNASTASGNTVVGYNAGLNITTGSNNTIIGVYAATATMSNNIILADGQGTIRYQWNGTTNNFTGAATFSSSVTADSLVSNGGGQINTTVSPFVFYNSGGGGNAKKFGLNMTNLDGFKIYSLNDNGTTRKDNIIFANIDGNVGIGTTSPSSLLHTYSSTTGTQIIANFAAANYGSSSSRTYIQIGTQYGDGSSRIGSINTTGNQSALIFQTQSASSGVYNDAMYINGSGNVGIGTSSPSRKLDVNGVTRSNAFDIYYNSVTSGFLLTETQWTGVSGANNVSLVAEGGVIGGGNITFFTNGSATERMRITSGGQVQITQSGNGHTTGGISLTNTASNIWNVVAGGDSNYYFGYNGTSKANISPTTGNYTALSDVNKKKDFEESTIGLDAILGLKPTLFRMKDDEDTSEKHLGFIAQEVKEYIPQAYVETGDEENKFIGLQDRPIIAALVKAIQEQNQLITELRKEVDALKAK